MKMYRIVYTYKALKYGERADIYYVRADSQEEAEEKFKAECPDSTIETIREVK